MLHGSLKPDATGSNRPRIDEIKARLGGLDDQIPFLLLPVRIETRFAKGARALARVPAMPNLQAQLTQVNALIEGLAKQDLSTPSGIVKRRVRRFIDSSLQQIDAASTKVQASLDNVLSGDVKEGQVLSQAVRDLAELERAARLNLGNLKSEYLKHDFESRWDALVSVRLAPMRETIETRVIRRIKYGARLSVVSAADLRAHLDSANQRLAEASRARAASGWRGQRPTIDATRSDDSLVLGHLAGLHALLDHAVHAGSEERQTLTSTWRALDDTLGNWINALDSAEAKREAGRLRAGISSLGTSNDAGVRAVGIQEIDRSAAAYAALLVEMRQATLELRAPANSSAFEGALAALAVWRTKAESMQALLRQLIVLPAAGQSLLLGATGVLRRLVEARLEIVERGAANRPLRKDEFVVVVERTRRVLDAVDRCLDGTRATGKAKSAAMPLLFVAAAPTAMQAELWVRIFPDDVAIQSHERALTESEIDHGAQFWSDFAAAGTDDNLRRAAWSRLCALHRPHRAAWIARATKAAPSARSLAQPVDVIGDAQRAVDHLGKMIRELAVRAAPEPAWVSNWVQRATKVLRGATANLDDATGMEAPREQALRSRLSVLEAQLRAQRERMLALLQDDAERARMQVLFDSLFEHHSASLTAMSGVAERAAQQRAAGPAAADPLASTPTKAGSWTESPQVRVLPRRFVVVAIRNNRAVHVIAANDIPAVVTVGVGPGAAGEGGASYGLDANGNLNVDPRLRWLTDFDTAVAQGLAVRIALSDVDASQGFDRLLVLGVRESGANADRQALEELLESHRYTATGLEVLPIGTPTNNTESSPSGHSPAVSRDAMARYDLEFGDAAYTPASETTAPQTERTDGFRLAQALGIDPEALTRVGSAGRHTISDAVRLNRVLWPATMGHYLEDMFSPLISTNGVRHVENFFSTDVLARGALPSVRIGAQPYAILPTMAFQSFRSVRKWKFPPANQGEAHADAVMAEWLGRLQKDWLNLALSQVKRTANWSQAHPQQHFISMLAVHPTASELHWRYAMNSAPRMPLSTDVVSSAGGGAMLKVTYHKLLDRFQFLLQQAYSGLQDGAGKPLDPVKRWEYITELTKAAAAFDFRYLVPQAAIPGAAKTSALVLSVGKLRSLLDSLTAAHPRTMVVASRDPEDKQTLVGMLLRHSVLCAYREAAMDIWEADGLLSPSQRLESGTPAMFSVPGLGTGSPIYLTKWSFLLCSPAELAQRVGGAFSTGSALTAQLGTRSLADELVGFAAATRLDPVRFSKPLAKLRAFKNQLMALKQTDGLERLISEHLDLCSYRIDAWRSGLANRRLREQRDRSTANGFSKPGVYLGAYGWLENLRPDKEVPALAGSIPEGLTQIGEDPVYLDPRNQGLIYAPSPDHAVTAAILRSGYLSNTKQPDIDNVRAVNLSSRRVRVARWLLGGIRNGNRLGQLLGYRLERGLHEAYDTASGIELDKYIAKLRRTFPSTVATDPGATLNADRPRSVVDGLAVLERVRSHLALAAGASTLLDAMRADNWKAYPWGLESEQGELLIPQKSEVSALTAVASVLDDMADAVDALGDLILSESVYQVARGNLDRAAAVTSAMAEGRAPPDPQIVDPPRSAVRLKQRLVYVAGAIDGRKLSRALVPDASQRKTEQNAVRPPGWTSAPMTPMSCLEPTLNAWLATLLGPADGIGAWLADQRDASTAPIQVDLADLWLQPIDVVTLFAAGIEGAVQRLGDLVLLHAKSSGDIKAGDAVHWRVVVRDRHASWPSNRRSVGEVATLCEALHRMVAGSHAATSADFDIVETRSGRAENPDYAAELAVRVTECSEQLRDLLVDVTALVAANYDATIPELTGYGGAVAALLGDQPAILLLQPQVEGIIARAWRLGLDAHVPAPALDATRLHLALADALRSVYRTGNQRYVTIRAALAESVSVVDLQETARQLFGGVATALPQFAIDNADALVGQLGAPASKNLLRNLDGDALDDWLHGAGKVRERVAAFDLVRLLAGAHGQATATLRAAQLPYVPGDYWIGGEYPASYSPTSDKLSIVFVEEMALLNGAGTARVGLVLDEWEEAIPEASQTTAVALHYDAPDSSPPQCALLVVTPVESGSWTWEDLVRAVDETLDLAMVRMVEPDHLQDAFYGHLLPALAGEVLPEGLVNSTPDRPSLNLAAAVASEEGA
jgi:hypothetical protein